MDELDITTLDLADIGGLDHQERLEKIYEWRVDNWTDWAKLLLGTALSNLLALLFDFVKGGVTVSRPLVVVASLVGLAGFITALIYLRRAREFPGEYVEGLGLLTDAVTGSEAHKRLLRAVYGGAA